MKDDDQGRIIYSATTKDGSTPIKWTIQEENTITNSEGGTVKPTLFTNLKDFSKEFVSLLLPAQYPKSVAPGYLGFASFCFSASVAGSAAMVLSTQTLLLAVGIVGQNVQQASIMAGAFNWVMKDFVGQLGGVIFASQMGKTRAFDSDPKRWRMVAAIALDSATLLEILAPLFHSSLVLPVASVANIGKNIGFLTASASRAALHQSLAISGNLGDVTAKSGSQAIMASLIGTSLGIGLSSFLQHDTFNFAMGFFCLSVIHQGCNYLSLQHVPLAHFNKQRLRIVLDKYIDDNNVPCPADVARAERFLPFLSSDATTQWLSVGRPLQKVCPNPSDFEKMISLVPDESYLLTCDENTRKIDLLYIQEATGKDVIRGMYHACLLHRTSNQSIQDHHPDLDEKIRIAHQKVQDHFPALLDDLVANGWNVDSDVTIIESTTSCRISLGK